MSSYLPKDSNGSPYAEGGGLYALGLIHANHGEKIVEYLKKELRNNQNEVCKACKYLICVCAVDFVVHVLRLYHVIHV